MPVAPGSGVAFVLFGLLVVSLTVLWEVLKANQRLTKESNDLHVQLSAKNAELTAAQTHCAKAMTQKNKLIIDLMEELETLKKQKKTASPSKPADDVLD